MAGESYTKLFSTIVTSTIWSEPASTCKVWVTMLAVVDRRGHVMSSIPGLARLANVSLQECEAALATFLAPDPYSRTKDNEGRRIAEIDGGWLLLNYAKYREKMAEADRREYKTQWQAKQREKGKSESIHKSPQESTQSTNGQNGHNATAEAEAEAKEEKQEIGESPVGDPPSPAEPKAKKPKREKRPDLTFDQWLATIPDDADIVPADDPLWSWWETQRLPFEWRPLAWAAFEQKYTGKPKRYADWLAVFRSAVREDWLKVWRILPDGSTVLTTVGEQLRRSA